MTIAATMICKPVSSSAQANDIVDEWGKVAPPPVPAIKSVKVDPKTTALLMLDFVQQDPYCGDGKPRCGATLPAMKRLLDNAPYTVRLLFTVSRGNMKHLVLPRMLARPEMSR
jgi:hypothetical protein